MAEEGKRKAGGKGATWREGKSEEGLVKVADERKKKKRGEGGAEKSEGKTKYAPQTT